MQGRVLGNSVRMCGLDERTEAVFAGEHLFEDITGGPHSFVYYVAKLLVSIGEPLSGWTGAFKIC